MNFYYRLREFMRGRNGVDALAIVVLCLSLIISFILTLCRVGMFGWQRVFVYLPMAYSFFRMLSSNTSARAEENRKFLMIVERLKGNRQTTYQTDFQKPKKDRKNYKYLKCKNCGAQLRVPKGKGKINVTCPKCRAKFQTRS